MLKKLLLTFASALLLAFPWLGAGGWSLFFAFVPLLILGESRPRFYWLWVALCFTIWNVSTTWWVGIATPVATFGIPVGSLFFTLTPFMIFHWFRHRAPAAVSWTIFVTVWIAFEALFMNNEISFPWLTLGYGFMNDIRAIQWYEWTGSFGGSIWVLAGNILVYQAVKNWPSRRWRTVIAPALWILSPVIVSIVIYTAYREEVRPVKITVVQPNIDPYEDKFGGMTFDDQRDWILELAQDAPRDADLIVTPETAFEDNFWLHTLGKNPTIDSIRRFMTRFPQAEFVAGATTYRVYAQGEPDRRWTHRYRGTGDRYDVFNSALGITGSTADVEVYHKSRLVVAAELFPYPKVFGLLSFLDVDLGGFSGNLGMQEERTHFTTPRGIQTGVAICYESIYGDYYADYARGGAQLMCIITNDGWWGDTPGHRHHFNYARMRAIETRRAIARSANTGISGFIDQRGDVLDRMGWEEEGILTADLNASDKITFYVRYGDYLVRISLLVLLLSILYYISLRFRKKGVPER